MIELLSPQYQAIPESITSLLLLPLLLVLCTGNNTDGNKLVIFSGIAWYYGDNYILLTCLGYHITQTLHQSNARPQFRPNRASSGACGAQNAYMQDYTLLDSLPEGAAKDKQSMYIVFILRVQIHMYHSETVNYNSICVNYSVHHASFVQEVTFHCSSNEMLRK